MTESSRITAVFKNFQQAEQAYASLIDSGYGADEIGLLMSEETRQHYFADKRHEAALSRQETFTAAPSDAIVEGLNAAGTSLFIPDVGFVVAALAGASANAAAGGLVGALAGWNVPREQAYDYAHELRNGAILLGFKPHAYGDAERFTREWKAKAHEMNSHDIADALA